ncbi:MAG: 2Fe-2S iron-sulfur cluster binding domain-containing protein [Acidimicrobiia bacterium]|nr:2Fe-2S iron-sulfur cluster binding domain-containing protein [Acidimicrobiia bacterium]
MSALAFVLNGREVEIGEAAAQTPLLDLIREQGLTGAKEGCAEGECGACAVLVVDADGRPGKSALRVVNSCLMLSALAAGREIYTVEALATNGVLSDAQRAMAGAGGSQCGYCTPGFVVSLFAEQHRPDRTGPCEDEALAGNLCRCTGYRPIHDAAAALGAAPDGPLLRRLERAAPVLHAVSVGGFSRPATVGECVALLAATLDARLVGGATDLGVERNLRAKTWPHLISVEAIDELQQFTSTPERVLIGAALPLREIGERWRDAPDAVHEWLTLFGSPPIRNRATLGGNLATASPVGDGAPLLMALDAVLHIAGPSGSRTLPIAQFFTGYRKTALMPGEMLTAIEIPKPLPQSVRFFKIAKRRADDISTVALGVSLDVDRGRVRRARWAFGGVAATPLRVVEAEAAVSGGPWNADAVARVQAVLDKTLRPVSDHRGSKEYRLEVSKSLVEKYYWELQS